MVSATVRYVWEHAQEQAAIRAQIIVLENVLATWQLERGDDPLVITMERALRELKALIDPA